MKKPQEIEAFLLLRNSKLRGLPVSRKNACKSGVAKNAGYNSATMLSAQ